MMSHDVMILLVFGGLFSLFNALVTGCGVALVYFELKPVREGDVIVLTNPDDDLDAEPKG